MATEQSSGWDLKPDSSMQMPQRRNSDTSSVSSACFHNGEQFFEAASPQRRNSEVSVTSACFHNGEQFFEASSPGDSSSWKYPSATADEPPAVIDDSAAVGEGDVLDSSRGGLSPPVSSNTPQPDPNLSVADMSTNPEIIRGPTSTESVATKASSAPVLKVYFVGKDGRLKGPFNADAIRNWYYSKRLSPTIQARLESEQTLSNIGDVVKRIDRHLGLRPGISRKEKAAACSSCVVM